MKIRFVCASAAAAFGFACSSSAFSRVVVAYAPAAVVVAEPRPVYYYGPPVRPAYYYTPPPPYTVPVVLPVPVAVAVPPPVPKPLPVYTTVVVPAPTNYGLVPAANVMYAQPVIAVPR